MRHKARLKKSPPARRAPGIVLLLLLMSKGALFFLVLVLLTVRAADDISASAEYNFINSNIETTSNETGDVTASDFVSFDQNYNISLSRELYPFLTLSGGGSFELDDSTSTSDEITVERTAQNIRPYIDLNLRSPLYSAGISYSKNQLENEITDIQTTKDFQESLDFSLTYRPAGLPLLRVFYNQAHSYNDPKTNDTFSTQTTVRANYAVKKHPVNYTYGRGETEDRINNITVIRDFHDANASYSRGFLNDRLYLDASYRVRYNITTVPGSDAATTFPLSPAEGLFSVDNTPQDGPALDPLTALIDGNLTASTGINMGWGVSGQAARGIGLDFGFPLDVDQIFIYVDRNVQTAALNSLSWAVYTSPDNTDTSVWTLHATVFPASFAVFQNRFEMSFPTVTARFIKVVASPLSSTFIATNPELENLFVTEAEALVTATVARDEKITDSNHNVSVTLAGRLTDKTRIGYNLVYSRRETDTEPSRGRYSWAHSIYMNHEFNRIFSGSARASRDEDKATSENATVTKSINYDYSANLRAAYLDTFSQSLTYGYSTREDDQDKQISSSVFLRTSAALYKGWDAFVDVGYSWDEPPDEGRTTSSFLTAQTSVVPNRQISFDATYSMVTSEIEEEGTANTRRSYDMRASYFPYRNLSLSFQISVEEESRQDSRQVLQRYSASWSPFRGGDIQVLLSYSESRRPSDDQEERTWGPVVKWDISRYASLDVAYFYTTVETLLETTDLSTMTAKLTMTF